MRSEVGDEEKGCNWTEVGTEREIWNLPLRGRIVTD